MDKKLPIGIQTFSKIREDDYVYVDKTGFALDLIENGTYYFLARPRRFGKSLFVSTLQALFEGRKELFRGLAAYTRRDWSGKHPVIKLSFSGVARTTAEMRQDIRNLFLENQERLGVSCRDADDIGGCFSELIRRTCEQHGRRVAVLIDEYDKLILDNLDQTEIALEAREILKDLYTTLKDCDEFIEFAFLTGVSKFAKVSIFSGLNNLIDISLNEEYAAICGYTEKDLAEVFQQHLKNADMDRVREWYDGYNFLGAESVYNPFDILLFINNNLKFSNYWFATGTPTFLIRLIRQQNYFIPQLKNLKMSDALLDSFDIEHIRLESILFQSGYVTIQEVRELEFGGHEYLLRIPNKEVALSLHDAIIAYLTDTTQYTPIKSALYTALRQADFTLFEETLVSLFAAIPYNTYVNNTISEYEGYFAAVLYAYLAGLGIDLRAEDVTNKGRIDLTVRLDDNIYILEFKVDGDRDAAVRQIRTKGYHQKYLQERKNIYLVGISFSSSARNLNSFAWEQVEQGNIENSWPKNCR
jgi:hypothetical protein